MVEFYVRWITIKKMITLDEVAVKWHADVESELIRTGYINA